MNELDIIISNLQSLTFMFKELQAIEGTKVPKECLIKVVNEKCNQIINLTPNLFQKEK